MQLIFNILESKVKITVLEKIDQLMYMKLMIKKLFNIELT